jgi:hypothetical protein
MVMRLFYANARGLSEHTESRRRFGEDGVDREETEERDVWIRRELVNRKREEAEEEAEAEGRRTRRLTPLTPSYAHVVLICS